MRRILPLFIPVFLACGDDDMMEPVETTPNITGVWDYGFEITNSAGTVACASSGTLIFAQSGTSITGTLSGSRVCTDGVESIEFTDNALLTEGQISGTILSFVAGFCSFIGEIEGSPPSEIAGATSCTIDFLGQSVTLTGGFIALKEMLTTR